MLTLALVWYYAGFHDDLSPYTKCRYVLLWTAILFFANYLIGILMGWLLRKGIAQRSHALCLVRFSPFPPV